MSDTVPEHYPEGERTPEKMAAFDATSDVMEMLYAYPNEFTVTPISDDVKREG